MSNVDAGLRELGRTLAARDAFRTAGQSLEGMTTARLREELALMREHRESDPYTYLPLWAEHVEDRLDAIEEELARRDAQARLGR